MTISRRKRLFDIPPGQLRGKRVLVRVDFNVPLHDGGVADDTRIRASLPTIEYLVANGARVVLLSHLGRPRGKHDPQFSLRPVADRLGALLQAPVLFVPSTVGAEAEAAVGALADGSVAVMENTRFLDGEEKNDESLSRGLAALGDIFVNDAFGSAHRAHASTAGVAAFVRPAVAGLLLEKELDYLGAALDNPKRPFVAILGGAKISGKIDVIENLLPKVDAMLIGGAMACTFLRARGVNTGSSLVEEDKVALASSLLERFSTRLSLPVDAVVSASLDNADDAHAVPFTAIPEGEAMYDIGPQTASAFASVISEGGTVLWNGPMGVFERPPFDSGTNTVAEALVAATDRGAVTVVGGGDSAAAIARLNLGSRVTHVSTGGGASLEFLEGRELPGVNALDLA